MGHEPIVTGEMLKHGSETPEVRVSKVSVEIPGRKFSMCFSADWFVGHLTSQFFNFAMDKLLFPWAVGAEIAVRQNGMSPPEIVAV